MMMSLFQIPAVVALFLTWFTTPPASLAEASQREALRRSLVARSTRTLNDNNTPSVPVPDAAIAYAVAGLQSGAKPPVAASDDDDDVKKPAAAPVPAAPSPSAGKSTSEPVKQEEAVWRERIMGAREVLSQDQFMLEAMQTRFNSLQTDITNRDDPAQRSKLEQDRVRVQSEIARLKKQIPLDEQAIADIQNEARKLNVPPGWIR